MIMVKLENNVVDSLNTDESCIVCFMYIVIEDALV